MNHESKRPVTLEDLLQLKRAERPPAEFWTGFDRDLRAKQLAALVEKRPWWRTMPRVFAGFSRYHLPIGATAILAVTFFTVRDYHPTAPAVPDHSTLSAPVTAAPVIAAATPAPVVTTAPSSQMVVASVATLTVEEEAPASAPAAGDTTQLLSAIAMTGDSAREETLPSARSIAANFAVAHAQDPELARRWLGGSHGFEARAMPAPRQPAVEPLAQMTPPARARSTARLSVAVPASFGPSASGTEKITRRMSDEQLYERISRVNASGSSVSFKL